MARISPHSTSTRTTGLAGRSLGALKWNYLGTGIKVLSQLVIGIVLARLLGPEPFGLIALAWLMLGLGNLIADSGLGVALIQKQQISARDIRYVFTLQMLAGTALALLGFALSPPCRHPVYVQCNVGKVLPTYSPITCRQPLPAPQMNITETSLPGVLLIEPKVFGDARGFFLESWNRQSFAALGLDLDFVQDNHSRSGKGVLRGLHYQLNEPQGKLVRVTQGRVFDVAVDMRRSSPNFGRWAGVELTADNHRMLWIPPGYAHGFLVLSESADFLYKTTTYYAPQWDRGVRWDDPEIGVQWPLDGAPLLSAKDQVQPLLKDAEVYA